MNKAREEAISFVRQFRGAIQTDMVPVVVDCVETLIEQERKAGASRQREQDAKLAEEQVMGCEPEKLRALLAASQAETREKCHELGVARQEIACLRAALRLCGAQAGAADPALGCRLIVRTVEVGLNSSGEVNGDHKR